MYLLLSSSHSDNCLRLHLLDRCNQITNRLILFVLLPNRFKRWTGTSSTSQKTISAITMYVHWNTSHKNSWFKILDMTTKSRGDELTRGLTSEAVCKLHRQLFECLSLPSYSWTLDRCALFLSISCRPEKISTRPFVTPQPPLESLNYADHKLQAPLTKVRKVLNAVAEKNFRLQFSTSSGNAISLLLHMMFLLGLI